MDLISGGRPSHVEDYCRAPTGGLTTRYHGYTITDKSDEGQDASLRIEMGDPDLIHWQYSNIVGAPLLPVLEKAFW